MKTIVMLQGMGINERGWAMLVSQYGRVILVQQGYMTHVEVWENQKRIFNGPNVNVLKSRLLDEVLFGSISAWRTLLLTLEHTKDRKIDLIVSTNYHASVAALLLKAVGKARKVVPFLTDYMPPGGSFFLRLHRRISAFLMRLVSRLADEVWLLSPRIHTGKVNPRNYVVPIYISQAPDLGRERLEIAYIGYPSFDHALDILFRIAVKHGFKVNVIGDSPYLQSIKHLAPANTVFHGMTNDENQIGEILSRCFCGYCVYRDLSPRSYSYYGFPSKTLYSFANNVPIVITNVADFNHTYEEKGVGRVVEPDPERIEEAVLELKRDYPRFSAAIDRFRTEWNEHVGDFHRKRLKALGL